MTRRLFSASVSVTLAIMIAIATMAFVNLRNAEESARHVLRSSRFLSELSQTLSRLRDAESAQLVYLVTGDTTMLRALEDSKKVLPALLRELEEMAGGEDMRVTQLRTLASLISRRIELLSEDAGVLGRSGGGGALASASFDRGKGLMDRIGNLAAEIEVDERARLEDWRRASTSTLRSSLVAMAAGSLVAAILLVVAIAALRRQLAARLAAQREAERYAREAATKNAALAAVNEELESFSYSVSHDLRVPLRAIDGYSRMLQEDIDHKLDDEDRRKIKVVRDNARRMGQLIDDLLQLSRLGRKPLEPAVVDMQALVEECCRLLQDAAKSELPAIRAGELPPAWADKAMLRQVLVNLLANAVKFTAKREQPHIEVGGRRIPEGTEYWVRDNGAGFEMDYAAKLFGVFQRLHAQDEFPGTGVGLAIVKRVVTRHGGRVRAEGRVGEGAAFHFTLPAKDETT